MQCILISPSRQLMRLARMDYKQGDCLKAFKNTTLDFTRYNYAFGTSNLTVLYGCKRPVKKMPGQFRCKISGVRETFGYYQRGVVTASEYGCRVAVVVPIRSFLEPQIPFIGLSKVFMKGFEVNYMLRDQDKVLCDTCESEESRGVCGYDNRENRTLCLCSYGRASGNTCRINSSAKAKPGQKSSKKNSKTLLIIGLSVGGVAAALVAGIVFIVVRRRKQLQNRFNQNSTVQPSNRPPQSIPSSPSANSNLETAGSYNGLQLFFYKELKKATDNFNKSRVLGDGAFSIVYYGRLHDGREVAVKRFYESSAKRMEEYMSEVDILARLRHKNLVKLYGCTPRKSKQICLVYEFIPNGTIADHLHGKLSETSDLSWDNRVNIAVDSAEALSYLHDNEVVHRDVKSPNILLNHNFEAKVADFGLARLFPVDVTHVSTIPQGTPGYVDPEYYTDYHLTEGSDVYSFGVVLIELLSSEMTVDITRPRREINLAKLAVDRIQNHGIHRLVDPKLGYNEDDIVHRTVNSVAELALQCLSDDRTLRPTMSHVLEVLKEVQKEFVRSVTLHSEAENTGEASSSGQH